MTRPPRTLLIAVTSACGLVAAVIFLHALPEVTATCGLPPLDTRPFWTRTEAIELARACDGPGIAAYTRLALLDLLHPALVAGTLVLWVRWSRSPRPRAAIAVQTIIVLGAVADYLENWTVWTFLRGGPDLATSIPLTVGGGFSLAKNILVLLGVLAAAVLILDAMRHRALSRRAVRET